MDLDGANVTLSIAIGVLFIVSWFSGALGEAWRRLRRKPRVIDEILEALKEQASSTSRALEVGGTSEVVCTARTGDGFKIRNEDKGTARDVVVHIRGYDDNVWIHRAAALASRGEFEVKTSGYVPNPRCTPELPPKEKATWHVHVAWTCDSRARQERVFKFSKKDAAPTLVVT